MKILNATIEKHDESEGDAVNYHDFAIESYKDVVVGFLVETKQQLDDRNPLLDTLRWISQIFVGALLLAYAYRRYGKLYCVISGTYITDVCIYNSDNIFVGAYELR